LFLFSAGNQGEFFMKKKLIIIVLVLGFFLVLGLNVKQKGTTNTQITLPAEVAISYKGENGKDALTILKQKFSVSQDNSGIVNIIGGKKADAGKHEYWAFYVNGKTASVGPADYKTIDKDLIEWKIEKY
jgi:hypothetical protein